MNPLRPLAVFFGFALCLRAAPSPVAPAPDIPTILREWLDTQRGGVAAALITREGVAFHEAGKFSADDPRPITADTQFEIGSITKVFTALLLADAVETGRLKLDAPVGAPFAPSTITLEQLATHTSGLPRLSADLKSSDPANPYARQTSSRLVKSFDAISAKTRPSASNYSNFGFAVLGQSVAASWNEPYAPLLRRRVLAPLDMTDTVVDWHQADDRRLAPGHDENQPAAHWDLAAYAPAGSLVSTTRDLAKFVRFCLAADPARPLHAALSATLKARVPSDDGGQVGLAWQIAKQDGVTVYWHNGGTGGFRSFLAFSPDTGRGVVLLTNHTRGLEAMGFALLADRRPAPPRSTQPPSAELAPYVGDYPLSRSFIMAVTASGNELFVQATKQSRLRLKRVTPDRYAVEGVDAAIVFERDPSGAVVALVLEQNGARQRASRKPPGDQ